MCPPLSWGRTEPLFIAHQTIFNKEEVIPQNNYWMLLGRGNWFRPTKFNTLCNARDCSLPSSSVPGIFQARILKWVSMPYSRGSSQTRDWTHVSCIGRRILYHWATWKALYAEYIMRNARLSESQAGIEISGRNINNLRYVDAAAAKLLQLCPTLCDPIDGSPPGFSVPGILQARILEWVAISCSNAWKWKVKVKLLSRIQLFETPWTVAY